MFPDDLGTSEAFRCSLPVLLSENAFVRVNKKKSFQVPLCGRVSSYLQGRPLLDSYLEPCEHGDSLLLSVNGRFRFFLGCMEKVDCSIGIFVTYFVDQNQYILHCVNEGR